LPKPYPPAPDFGEPGMGNLLDIVSELFNFLVDGVLVR
jgi:hypothetical protein